MNKGLTPIKIIILGGALATLFYSAWDYVAPYFQSFFTVNSANNTVKAKKTVVKDLFKTKNNKIDKISKDTKPAKAEIDTAKKLHLLDEYSIVPITENERQSLIAKARASIEGRLDPFSQSIIVQEKIEEEKTEQKKEEVKDIPVLRKQVELVGVISSNNKNLALINVYNADFTVLLEDDNETKKTKLKTALSMAVPNRLEVSLLDPIEDWYVKQVIKGKNKADDPYVELVRGNQKFKLKVGQKVLLPEDEPMG